jgi:hypothetical protein
MWIIIATIIGALLGAGLMYIAREKEVIDTKRDYSDRFETAKMLYKELLTSKERVIAYQREDFVDKLETYKQRLKDVEKLHADSRSLESLAFFEYAIMRTIPNVFTDTDWDIIRGKYAVMYDDFLIGLKAKEGVEPCFK